MIRALFAMLLLLPLAGCVTSGEFEKKNAALSVCLANLDATREQAQRSVAQRESERRQTAEELGVTSRELEACRQDVDAATRRTDTLKAREADLRSRLQTELGEKNVEIERLKDSLSLRVLDRILFRSGSASILQEGQAVLDKVAAVVKETDDLIRIEGHTDDVPIGPQLKGKYFSNWELSGARAASVVRYFEHAHKIDPPRMEAVGLSLYRPVAPNDSEDNRRRNRRVVITLTTPLAAVP